MDNVSCMQVPHPLGERGMSDIVLYRIVLYCIVLHCIVLHCIANCIIRLPLQHNRLVHAYENGGQKLKRIFKVKKNLWGTLGASELKQLVPTGAKLKMV